MKFNFLVLGLGSMGQRRIRNLLACGERDITGFDINKLRSREVGRKYGIKITEDFKNYSVKNYNVMIISASPETHGEYIRIALKNKKHFFVEHPANDEGYKEILRNKNRDLVKAPSCTFRFYKPVRMIKKILESGKIGKILAFQYHMGQYLPDWHPWEDYRKVYFSKKKTGACREMFPFELIWLNWLLNSSVSEATGFVGKVSDLDMDADDIILANLRYKNGVAGQMMIEVISRKPLRALRILGTKGVLDWDRFSSKIDIYDGKTKKTKTVSVPKGHPEKGYVNEEEMYREEIKTFLDAIKDKKKYPFSFQENLANLRLLDKLETLKFR